MMFNNRRRWSNSSRVKSPFVDMCCFFLVSSKKKPNSNIIFSATLSHSPYGLSALREYHFFSEPGPRKDHCPVPNLLACTETSRAFDSHSFSMSLDPHDVVKHRHEHDLSCEILWCLIQSQQKTFDFLTELNPWKIFHSNSIGSPSIQSKFLHS